MAREFELIDVCHSVEDGMVTYKGLPAPVITDHLSREGVARGLRAGNGVSYRKDRDGGEHRHVSRHSVSSLRAWTRSCRTRSVLRRES